MEQDKNNFNSDGLNFAEINNDERSNNSINILRNKSEDLETHESMFSSNESNSSSRSIDESINSINFCISNARDKDRLIGRHI